MRKQTGREAVTQEDARIRTSMEARFEVVALAKRQGLTPSRLGRILFVLAAVDDISAQTSRDVSSSPERRGRGISAPKWRYSANLCTNHPSPNVAATSIREAIIVLKGALFIAFSTSAKY